MSTTPTCVYTLPSSVTGFVRVIDPYNPNADIGIIGDNGLCVDVDADEVKKIVVNGSSVADFIDLEDVGDNDWPNLEYSEIHGGAGDDEIEGTEIDDRIFGGPGDDDINGRIGQDYVLDDNQQGDADTLTSAAGLSEIWKWDSDDNYPSQSAWDSFVAVDPQESPQTKEFMLSDAANVPLSIVPNSNNPTFSTIACNPLDSTQKILVPKNYLAPDIDLNGHMVTTISARPASGTGANFSPENHCHIGPWIPELRGSNYVTLVNAIDSCSTLIYLIHLTGPEYLGQ